MEGPLLILFDKVKTTHTKVISRRSNGRHVLFKCENWWVIYKASTFSFLILFFAKMQAITQPLYKQKLGVEGKG